MNRRAAPSVTSSPTSPAPGVYSTAQLLTQITRGQLRATLQAGRWQRHGRGVIVTHNGPLTEAQRIQVALLGCAPDTALAGLTALMMDGFSGFATPAGVQVILSEGAVRPEGVSVIPHWSTELTSADVHPLKHPRRTRPQRSLVDEAAWSDPRRRARAIILAGVQQGLTRPSDLRDALSRRGPCRHRALIKESILDADGGIHSLPERDFELIRRRHGLPSPTRQQVLQRADGRFFLDLGRHALDDAAEIHGIPHLEVLQWDSDLLRANEIVIRGPRLLIFSSYAVRHEPEQVATQVIALLRRQGWDG